MHVHTVGALPHSRSPRIDLFSLIESVYITPVLSVI
jgi:hypothetical protein